VIRIAEIDAGSIADELHMEIGSRIVRINGETVRDGIDLTFLLADPDLEIEAVDPSGASVVYDIERDPGEVLGIVPAPDAIRECANKCVFCFIDGNPPDVRDTLWLRDDDFRLSFTYGSYVTLTNLGPRGMARLVDQKISPLYVSVHATDPVVRERLLVSDRGGLIMDQLNFLLDGGLEVHTQVVLCPEWNDGSHLDQTIEELYGLGEGVRSLSVVPVGLTRYNLGKPVRLLLPHEADAAIEQVERIRRQATPERGYGWAYAADEMFLIAGRDFPRADYYDDGVLSENGVGSVDQFFRKLDVALPGAPDLTGTRLRIVTGASMGPLISARQADVASATGAEVEVVQVTNEFFGETVSVAGLLGGEDIARALGDSREGDTILLPAETLNADRLFIDSVPFESFEEGLAPAEIVAGYDLEECFAALGGIAG
jgi:putative radical SAM enzyme (TIGR03279 family)